MTYSKLLNAITLVGVFLVLSITAKAQCNGGGTYAGDLSMLPTFQTVSVNAGDRWTFDAYEFNTYIFSFCQGGGNYTDDTQIEICDENGNVVYEYNDDHCGLGSELTWTAPSNGTYSIVIYDYYCNETGASMGTLAYQSITPPNEQDCLGAIPLCFNSYSTTNSYSGEGHYTGEIPVYGGSMADDNCPGNCLLGGEVNDVWYTFTVQSSGTVSFTISPNDPADDYDWAVYDLTNAHCVDIASSAGSLQVSCNFCGTAGDTGPTGGSADDCQHGNSCTPFNDALNVTEGETYVVNVSNWSSTQSGYSITFGGTAQIVDNEGPEMEDLLYQPECGASSLTVQFSERLWCTSVQETDFILTGPEGNYQIDDVWSEICQAGAGSTYGDTYYDDVWTLDLMDYLEHDGDYTLTVVGGGVDDICSNYSPQNSIDFTIDGVTADTLYGHLSCYGANDGWAEVTNISGSTGPYTTTWIGPSGFTATGTSISGLGPGAYTVNIEDTYGRCTFTETINIGEPSQISFNTSTTNPGCSNNDGEITVSGISGMYPPFDISCTGQSTVYNASSHTFTGLSDGTYTIVVTDDHGCTNSNTVTLNAPPIPDATFTYNGNQCINTQSFDFTHTGTSVTGETYNWSFSGGTPSSSTSENPGGVTFGSAGTHNVSLTVSAGSCIDSYNTNITVYDTPDPNVSTTDENCGLCDGEAIATTGLSSYSWSSGGTSDTETGLCAGNYTITVEDANGCSNTESFTINNQGSIPSANVVTTDPDCPGDCDGTATVNASGPSTFTYAWSAGTTPNNQSTDGLCAGSYDVTVSDGSNPACSTVEPFSISDPAGMTLTMSGTDANCGLSNGSASVSVSGGTTPYSYNWSNGGVTGTIDNIPAGNYTVTVTDGNNCTASNDIIINDTGAPFSITASVNQNAQCEGACDGEASVSVTGGTGPFTYQWSSGSSPNSSSTGGLCAGTHTVTVTEGACSITETVTITEPSAITGTISSTDAHCGQSDGSITVAGSGGTIASDYSYEWDCVPAQFTATASNLPAGTYHVTLTDDNSCTAEFTGSIMDVGGVAINESHNNTLCSYSSDGSATINVLSGDPDFTYDWSHGINQTTSSTSHSLNNLSPDTYTVTVTDTWGCSAMTSFTINPAPVLSASITDSEDVSCNGLCDGSATGLGTGGTGSISYNWGAANGNSPDQPDNSGLCPGNYTLTVTDDNACTDTASVTIEEPSQINLLTSSTDTHCGQADGTASVIASGGTVSGDYDYLWSGGSQPTSANNTGLSSAGSPYTVSVTDDNGCEETATVNISDEPGATVSISNTTDITCFGDDDGTATVSIGGGTPPFSITWGTSPAQNSATATDLGPGTHTVTVTDMYGCDYTANATIHEPSALSVNAVAPIINCYGDCNGSAMANPSGGTAPYTYLWSDFQNSQMAIGLCAGDYTVTVEDDNGCTSEDSITIDQNSEIDVTADITESDCGQSNGAIELTVTGGSSPYNFDWAYGPHTEDLLGIPSGTYEVTITDNKGCESIEVFAVNDLSGPTVTISSTTDASCNSGCNGQATADVAGGTGTFDYQWNTTPVQTNQTATNLCAGTYNVEVTDMTTGCMAITSATINEPTQLDVSAATVDPTCHNACNGEIHLTPFDGTPPYSFTWTGPGTLPADEDLTGLCDGTYTVVITDANGCMITRNYTLTEPAFINVTTSATTTDCSGSCDGEATANATGGTAPYTFEWSDPNNQTSETAVNLCPGGYGVTVTDDNGCTGNSVANVPDPAELIISSASVTDASCHGLANGEASVTVAGGTPPYNYIWSNASSTNSVNNLAAGTHCVTVWDDNDCTTDTCLIIDQPDPINVVLNETDESCNGFCDGEIIASVSGGTAGYTYNWSNSSSSQVNDDLCPGLYLLTVTDANGCEQNTSAGIGGPSILDIVVQDTVMPHCGNSNGSITVGVVGGTSPYSYSWENYPSETSAVLSGIPSGNYTVSVTDDHACSAMHTIDLNDLSAPVIDSINITNVDCHGNATGQAEVFFTSGTSSNTISWDDPAGQSSPIADNLAAGQYTVQITDDNSCSTSETITITEPSELQARVDDYTDVSCNGFCNGTAEALYIGGTPPMTYNWTGGHSGQNVSGLCPGDYELTVTDDNGCTSTEVVTISEPTAMTLSESITPVTCHGGSDGSIAVTVSGGSGNYDYEWFGTTENNPTASGLSSANYNIVVYNASDHSCFVTESYFVPQPDEIDASFSTANVTCNESNGSAWVSGISGGTPGYNYTWTPGNIIGSDSVGNLTQGTYTCLVEDAYGCTADFDVDVDETPAPQLDNTTVEPVSCYGYNDGYGEVIISGGTPPYNYNWNPDVSDQSSCNTLAANLYTVTISDVNDCEVYATLPITSPEEVEALPSGADTICIGQSAQITTTASGGTEPYTYHWDDLGSGNTHIVEPEVTSNYIVTVVDDSGCSSQAADVEITVKPPLNLNVATDGAICQGQTAVLSAAATGGDGNYTYDWGNGMVTDNPQLAFSPETSTHFEVVLTDGCGTPADTAEITLSVSPQPEIDIIRDPTKGCAPLEISFLNNTSNNTYTYLWNFDDEDSGDDNTSTSQQTSHLYEEAGYYDVSLTVTTSQGCTGTVSESIRVKMAPVADFIAQPWTAGAFSSSVHFNDESIGASAWEWHFGDEGMSTVQNPDYIFEEPGDIPVTLIAFNNIGCTDTITQEVHIIEEHRFYVPTAINLHSPGNNEFYPKGVGIDYDTYEMTIFDRWGEPLFTTTNIDEHWEGRSDQNAGDYVPQGVYTWIITLRDKFGKEHTYSGKVTVFN
ncbi:MAG: PKD domain-containing protein [Bacteroidales bacterium]